MYITLRKLMADGMSLTQIDEALRNGSLIYVGNDRYMKAPRGWNRL